ncbi:MAG: fatty acid kinase fatty acid binding subunit [Actinomycetota bacterium]|nr:fatty acid kinase fatty acid binding subunit [Actinomycetota bacterium]
MSFQPGTRPGIRLRLSAMSETAVVTDSTAYLPDELVEENGIGLVRLQVIVAGRSYQEGTEIHPAQVAEALREWKVITTSRPTPAEFLTAYTAAAEAGATGVVSVHLSAHMSGTYESAMLAARESPIPVRVIDSGSVGMGLGFVALAAARSARNGDALAEVVEVAERVSAGATVLFYVDTLEFLRRGGRIGGASAALGTALRVKPLLQLVNGEVAPLEKARTASRALARLQELVLEKAAGRQVDVAVQHLASEDRARSLAADLSGRLSGTKIGVSEVGAVVGAHVGPGMVCVCVAPKP